MVVLVFLSAVEVQPLFRWINHLLSLGNPEAELPLALGLGHSDSQRALQEIEIFLGGQSLGDMIVRRFISIERQALRPINCLLDKNFCKCNTIHEDLELMPRNRKPLICNLDTRRLFDHLPPSQR